jgi:hypothetical protein
MNMSEKTEGALALVAAFVLLFSAMLWDPGISAGMGVVVLVAWAVFKFIQARRTGSKI